MTMLVEAGVVIRLGLDYSGIGVCSRQGRDSRPDLPSIQLAIEEAPWPVLRAKVPGT